MEKQKCLGERYLGCGSRGGTIVLEGTPGNALGAYLDGSDIILYGNAQDATGDTMNCGSITIYGNTGDAAGYAMRGGEIYVKGNAGYRAGIHMKEYKEKKPVLVIGGVCGSFLGEYQAGGLILVLGNGAEGRPPVGYFCGTGMHGGKIVLRSDAMPHDLPKQVCAGEASPDDYDEFFPYIKKFCDKFSDDINKYDGSRYFVLKPNTSSPYRQLYVNN